jgi:hypothetical protein
LSITLLSVQPQSSSYASANKTSPVLALIHPGVGYPVQGIYFSISPNLLPTSAKGIATKGMSFMVEENPSLSLSLLKMTTSATFSLLFHSA